MDVKLIDYLNNFSNQVLDSEGFLMSIGGGSTVFIIGLILLFSCAVIAIMESEYDYGYQVILTNYKKIKNNYLSSLRNYNINKENEINLYTGNNEDKPIFHDKSLLKEILLLLKFDKVESIKDFLFLGGFVLLVSGFFVGTFNEDSINSSFEENFDNTYLINYVNNYEIKDVEVLNDAEKGSYYVIMYKNGDTISKYNYYGNLKIGDSNKISFVSSKLISDVDKAKDEDLLNIDRLLYSTLEDKNFYSLEVSEDILEKGNF